MTRARLDEGVRERIRAAVTAEASRPPPPEVTALVAALRERFGADFAGALYYGSCRRQAEPEGVLDLHVLVADLDAALGRAQALLARLLPPNVYYLEVPLGDATVRCKYAVLSLRQFRRGCSRAAFHSYFWARYAQPLTLVGAADPESLIASLVDAVETMAWRAWPRLGGAADAAGFWLGALRLSYGAELRPEGRDRPGELVAADPAYFEATGAAVLAGRDALPTNGVAARLDWGARIAWGKLLSLLRLIKGLATFDGGLDYLAWKLERHTGRPIEIPERARRWPLLYLWPLVWRHWRQGTFR